MNHRITMTLLAGLLVVGLPGIAAAQSELQRAPDNTAKCVLTNKDDCYHVFDNTDTTTTADSKPYDVSGCDLITYKFDGDGTAELQVKECSLLSSGSCVAGDTSVFTDDMDGDGLITAIDEATTLDGTTAGRRGYGALPPRARYHYIDVQIVPTATTEHVTIKCHRY